MSAFMKTIVNPVVGWLLHSPFHGLLSKHVLLITVTGRKSGKQYTTPVEYGRNGNQIVVISVQTRSWWKNVRHGGTVHMRVQGKDVTGTARVAVDEASVAAVLKAVYPKLSEERRAKFAPGKVAIFIDPVTR
jgi:deazaflavin-dependent oxidoreductase (nitroreductase family)